MKKIMFRVFLRGILLSFLFFPFPTLADTEAAYKALQSNDYETARIEAKASPGDPAARILLGYLYREGLGVEKDSEQAIEHFKAAGEHPEALFYLAEIYELGIGVEKDIRKAEAYYLEAAYLKNPFAALKLAVIYEAGEAGVIESNLVQAFSWYTNAQSLGLASDEIRKKTTELAMKLTAEEKTAAAAQNRQFMTYLFEKASYEATEKERLEAYQAALALEAEVKDGPPQAIMARHIIKGYELSWTRQIAQDGHIGGVISTLDGGAFAFGYGTNPESGEVENLVVRYDSSGKLILYKFFRGPGVANFNDVIELEDGDFIGVGWVRIAKDSGKEMHAWMIRLDREGEIVWQRTYGKGRFETVTAHYVYPIIAAGTKFFPKEGALDDQLGWVVKIDKDGELLDDHIVREEVSNQWVKGVAMTYEKKLLMVGQFEDKSDPECVMQMCFGAFLGWVAEMNDSGEVLYSGKFGGPFDADLQAMEYGAWLEGSEAINYAIFAAGNKEDREGKSYPWYFAQGPGEGRQWEKTLDIEGEFHDIAFANDSSLVAVGRGYDLGQDPGQIGMVLAGFTQDELLWTKTFNGLGDTSPETLDFGVGAILFAGGNADDEDGQGWAWIARLEPIF